MSSPLGLLAIEYDLLNGRLETRRVSATVVCCDLQLIEVKNIFEKSERHLTLENGVLPAL